MTHKSIEELEADRFQWALKEFPEATITSSLIKAAEEIKEVGQAILQKKSREEITEEYVDVLMCVFDSAARAGIYVGDIREGYAKKLAKNKARTWKMNPDKTYSHVKEGSNG